jgi:predicted dehydrogenase
MTMRLGLVGAGGIGRAYLEITRGTDDVVLVAVADPDPDATRRAGLDAAVPAFASVDALLRGADVDAVVVCTPPDTHAAIALEAIGAGVAVLCEKPLAIRSQDAQAMIAAARAAAVPLTMATKFRFVADLVEARARVRAGHIGELIRIENTFASRVDMTNRWNSRPGISGGGVVIDNGTHSVDIVRSFLGPIAEVLVVEHPRVQRLEVEDGAQVLLRAATGAAATIELSWSYDNASDQYLHLYGSDGVIRLGWSGAAIRTNADVAWRPFGLGYDKLTCMRAQVVNFARALQGEETMAITDADAVASVQVVEAAYRSLHAGDWATVEPVQSIDEDVA